MDSLTSESVAPLRVEQVFSRDEVRRIQQGEAFLDGQWVGLANDLNWRTRGILNPGVGEEERLFLEFRKRADGEPTKWLISSKALAGVGYDQQAGILWVQSVDMGFDASDMARGQERKFGIRVSLEMKESERVLLEYLLGFVMGNENYTIKKGTDLNEEIFGILGQGADWKPPQHKDVVARVINPARVAKGKGPEAEVAKQVVKEMGKKRKKRVKREVEQAPRFQPKVPVQEKEKMGEGVFKEKTSTGLRWQKGVGADFFDMSSSGHPEDYQDSIFAGRKPEGRRFAMADGVSLGLSQGFSGSRSSAEAIKFGVLIQESSLGSLEDTLGIFQSGAEAITNLGTGSTLTVVDVTNAGKGFLVQQGSEAVIVVRKNGRVESVNDPKKVNVGRFTAAIKGVDSIDLRHQNRLSFQLNPGDFLVMLSDFLNPGNRWSEIEPVLASLTRGEKVENVADQLVIIRGADADGYFDDTSILITRHS